MPIADGPADIERWHREAQRRLNGGDLRAAHAACMRILTARPDHADAYFLLGTIAASAGNHLKAVELMERAMRLGAPSAEYLAQLARCEAMLRRDTDALRHAEEALELVGDDALTLDTIGVVFSRVGAHARAARAFSSAVALEPDNAAFQFNLGSSLRFSGQFDAAERAFDAAVRLDPRCYRAHSALAEIRRQTPADNHVERLLELLPGIGDDVRGELHVRHALAKEYEDLGNYGAAFEHLTAGKAKARRAVRYSIDEDRVLFELMQELFDTRRLEAAGGGCDNREPIFVVGMPRTGTTLVDRILSSHRDVTSAGELQDFALCVKRASAVASARVLDEQTIRRVVETDMRALGERYIESSRRITGGSARFVDKMPLNYFYVGLIHLALPRAKIVCLRRNALDTCVSNFRQLFAAGFSYYNYAYDLEDIGRYYALFDRLIAHWHAVLPGKVLEVRYEDLVTAQEAQTRRLLEHCGLDWDPACLDFERNAAPVATASAVQVRRRLNADSIGRWRRYAAHLEPLKGRLAAAGLLEPGAD